MAAWDGVERRNWATRPLQYLPTAHGWKPYNDVALAQAEADRMSLQYNDFLARYHSAPTEHERHLTRELVAARKFAMDAQSFVVSLRRRGFDWAMQELNIERTCIELEQRDLFGPMHEAQRAVNESKYSSLSHR